MRINDQRISGSAISYQPSAISHQLSAISQTTTLTRERYIFVWEAIVWFLADS
jgi:hypothetical protein